MSPVSPKNEAEDEEPEFKPLTPEQAREWRKRHPAVSVWRVLCWQVAAGVLVAVLAGVLTQKSAAAWSAAYGALCVVVPGAMFARGMQRPRRTTSSVMLGFFVWELAKVALTVAMLWMAPRWLPVVSWLALVVGMVVTMKAHWMVLLARSGVRKTID